MYINSIEIHNVKSFEDSNVITFSKGINLLVGANNSGKSTIIKSLYHLQDKESLKPNDLRIGSDEGKIIIEFEDIDNDYVLPFNRQNIIPHGVYLPKLIIRKKREDEQWSVVIKHQNGESTFHNPISHQEPNNLFYPYLSKRKVRDYNQNINKTLSLQVHRDLSNLVARIDRISNSNYEVNDEYRKLCEKIFNFQITSFPSDHGKHAGLVATRYESIPIDAMGEGISSLLGLITSLCLAENKVFLIEEIENDIHPKALKALLEVINEKSNNNQFIISTHSNIVVRMLGSSRGSKLHKIDLNIQNRIPTSIYSEVNDSAIDRIQLLEELGYELLDFNLWKGWLFLEESSAERIIREYLIPWFLPSIANKIKTFACSGATNVDPKFKDFNNVFTFIHLQPTYKNSTWVIIDGDLIGKEIIQKMKDKYVQSGWEDGNFLNFSKENFEEYYPSLFDSEVRNVLQITDTQSKRRAKKDLLDKVIAWIEQNESNAKKEFEISANEVIGLLKQIENQMNT